jgi:hypothetical protein
VQTRSSGMQCQVLVSMPFFTFGPSWVAHLSSWGRPQSIFFHQLLCPFQPGPQGRDRGAFSAFCVGSIANGVDKIGAEGSPGFCIGARRMSAYVGQRQITSMVDVHTRKVRPIGVDRKACFLKISSWGGRAPELLTMRFWRGTGTANGIHFSWHDRTILQPSLENSLCRV